MAYDKPRITCPRNPHIDCWHVTPDQAQLCLQQRICQAQGDKPKIVTSPVYEAWEHPDN